MKLNGEVRPLSPAAELTLYRAGQEGLTNVRKHARASRVPLPLDFQAGEKRSVCALVTTALECRKIQTMNNGLGLIGPRERAQIPGGEVRVHRTGWWKPSGRSSEANPSCNRPLQPRWWRNSTGCHSPVQCPGGNVLEPLSVREREVLCQLAASKSNKEIASTLDLAESTVKNHMSNILAKLGALDHT